MVVGSAAIVLQAERQALTSDIDILQLAGGEVQAAVERVAAARRWPSDWLNDAANMWASHFDTADDWSTYLTLGGVTVLVARPQLLLAMKLLAGRGRRDAVDIDLLLDLCQIESVDQAVDVFDRYYPNDSMAEKSAAQIRDRFSTSPGA